MSHTISITSIATVSPLGNDSETIWNQYQNSKPCFESQFLDQKNTWVGALDKDSKAKVAALRQSDSKYNFLDNSVLYAILASRKAMAKAGWSKNDVFGINIGSSRGATDLFENHFKEYISTGNVPFMIFRRFLIARALIHTSSADSVWVAMMLNGVNGMLFSRKFIIQNITFV